MLVLTLVCFLASMGMSSGVLYLIIEWFDLDVATTAPSLMKPIGLAMSIDYCLFMMYRYRAERYGVWTKVLKSKQEASVSDAVEAEQKRTDTIEESITTTVQTSGTVVSKTTQVPYNNSHSGQSFRSRARDVLLLDVHMHAQSRRVMCLHWLTVWGTG